MAQTEPLRFRRISVTDGLSQQFVISIAQDNEGMMWFGTQDGLNRFDGYSFTAFHSSNADSTMLSSDYIYSLLCTSDGKMWVGSEEGGASVYDPQTETFTTYRHNADDSVSLRSNTVARYYKDKKGTLWIATVHGGLSRMDTSGGTVRFIPYLHLPQDTSSLSDKRVTSIVEDREGNLWVGTRNGLNRMRQDGRFRRFRHTESDPYSLGGNFIKSLTLDSNGYIWVGTWDGGVSRYEPATNRFHVYRNIPGKQNSLSSNRINSVYADRQGTVWIGTYDAGLDRYDPANDSFIHYRHIPTDPSSLPSDEVQSFLQDAEGTFWIGTGSGVANVSPYRHKFPLLKFPDSFVVSSYKRPQTLYIDRTDGLWYGTRGSGLFYIPKGSNKFIRYRHSPKHPHSLSFDIVSALYEQRDGSFWVGTSEGGLDRLDRTAGKFQRYKNNADGSNNFSSGYIVCLLETSDSTLWIGTDGDGLFNRDSKTGSIKQFRYVAGDSMPQNSNFVWTLLEDKRKNVWVGTYGADLFRFDSKEQQFIRYRHIPDDSATIVSSKIVCLAEDLQEKIWIGTEEGLSCFDYKTNRFVRFTETNGIASQIINCIAVDRNNSVWVSTNRGISRFDQTTQTFRNYTVLDGLQGIEFDQCVFAKDSQGRLYFGGLGGINYFDPDSVRDNPFIPSVRITRMKVMEQPFSLVNISDDGIVLNHDQNFLSFEYSALSFAIPEKNLYSYMLEGLDTGWVEAGTRRYTSYTGLSPGTYIFRVRGSNNDAVWNLEGASLRIIITPPFWRRWWFVVSAIAALVLSVVSVVRTRERRLLSIERMRTRIARDLHDEIGSNLTGIAMSSKLMMQQKNFTETEQEQLTEIGTTAQRTSELMRDIVWLINPGNDSLEELLTRMKSTAYTLLGPIEHTFNAVMGDTERKIALELKQNIFLVYKEALTNIAKHSSATKVDISVNGSGELFELQISDNGIGISTFEDNAFQAITGNGLHNMRNRANSIGGNFSIESEAGNGTVVSLSVKME